jgi:membrane-bound ClpP family serine protease
MNNFKRGNTIQKKNMHFGFVVGGVFILLYLYALLFRRHNDYILFITGFLLLVAGLFIPFALGPIRKIWELAGNFLGRINSYILLSLIYFFLFVPFGLLFRLIGKDILGKKIEKKKISYWIEKENDLNNNMKFQF